ncbi:MAG: pentapeptide repeat-containing protein, partial [Actinomycetota bacterium]|nr:pentapeptide repeat-containing protein [Actinomycetota bacterium]
MSDLNDQNENHEEEFDDIVSGLEMPHPDEFTETFEDARSREDGDQAETGDEDGGPWEFYPRDEFRPGAVLPYAWGPGRFFGRCDLTGIVLQGAFLRRACLCRARLSLADLSESDLVGADLVGADLAGANLRGALLARAELRDADLSGADLSGADLSGADLRGVNLMGAT